MTSTQRTDLDSMLEAGAAAALSGLTIGEPTTLTALDDRDQLAAAVRVTFAGRRTGEFTLLVDEQALHALTRDGVVDLAEALAPAVGAVTVALGDVAAGAPAAVDPVGWRERLAGFAETGCIAVRGADGVRAALALGLQTESRPGNALPTDRLDLLRGVEMAVSAELGRARMTVNELLNLRAGAVVELDRAAGDPADLFVNGRLIARGEVVVVDENYALRITQIVTDDGAR